MLGIGLLVGMLAVIGTVISSTNSVGLLQYNAAQLFVLALKRAIL